MQYKKVLNILRFLLSASAILYGIVVAYSIYQYKVIIDIKTIFFLIISLLGGIIVGFTSFEDTVKIVKNKDTGLARIKKNIFVIFWAWGLFIGILFLVVLIYSILIKFI